MISIDVPNKRICIKDGHIYTEIGLHWIITDHVRKVGPPLMAHLPFHRYLPPIPIGHGVTTAPALVMEPGWKLELGYVPERAVFRGHRIIGTGGNVYVERNNGPST